FFSSFSLRVFATELSIIGFLTIKLDSYDASRRNHRVIDSNKYDKIKRIKNDLNLSDASTLTDICNYKDQPEVEIISLIEEHIPRYKLRADTLTTFSGYENQNWFIPSPALQLDSDVDLSPEQAEETFKYFALCSHRVSQMTKTYNDIEAVTRLLEEKEKDLELAARIGQSLLARNRDFEQKNDQMEQELTLLSDQVTQYKHELAMKTELLQIYAHDLDYSESDSNPTSPTCRDRISLHVSWDVLQKKIRKLEGENEQLKSEANILDDETTTFEEKEQQLVKDVVRQLSEANMNVDQLSEELSKKIDDNLRQQEEITMLLAQLVDFQQKNKKINVENEDLQQHLHAAKECQQELTTELADLKEKYREVVEMLHENQEQLRDAIRKTLPTATRRSFAHYYNNDSLASELESSLSSDNEISQQIKSDKQLQNLKIFETVRYARQRRNTTATSHTTPAQLSHLYTSTSAVQGTTTCSLTSCYSARGIASTLGGGDGTFPPLAPLLDTPYSVGSGPSSVDSLLNSDSEGSVMTDSNYNADDDSMCSSITSLGRPGIPGSKDLESALRRLSLRRQSEHEYQLSVQRNGCYDLGSDGTHTPAQCRTPDSIMSTGSLGLGPFNYRPYHMPEKLQIIKPMEGSLTLHHWQQLATPHLGGIFEERPGVQVKGERKLEEFDENFTLTDYEEDDDYIHPGKKFESTGTSYTYTMSTVLHPDANTQVTPSLPPTQMSVTAKQPPPVLNSPQCRERGTSTFSTTIGLAKLLNERGISAGVPRVCSRPPSPTHPYSPTATPCNSPDCTPPSSPPPSPIPFSPLRLPSLMALSSGVSRGADLLKRTFKPNSPNSKRVDRRRTGQKSSKSNDRQPSAINLMKKLNEIGIQNIMPPTNSIAHNLPFTTTNPLVSRTSPMTQLTSIRQYVNLHLPSCQTTPSSSLFAPEVGTIGTLPSLRKGGFL
uniref:HAP1 N-terminal domain-containing protein n=1 Tax=Strigamia maritima TaxID=126957 RepID=T1JHE0_STRMM